MHTTGGVSGTGQSGSVLFDEINVEISPGTFGEIAFFTRDGCRIQTVTATSDCKLLSIDGDQLKEIYFQNPEFGWYLMDIGLHSRPICR